LTDLDHYLIGEGTHKQLWRVLGANVKTHQSMAGVHFAVWAPNALRVSVVGDFNSWDERRHMLRPSSQSGVWETFIPGLTDGALYKFHVAGADGQVRVKADPCRFWITTPT
jgi:1,4-alpha-glucan branching enzyme